MYLIEETESATRCVSLLVFRFRIPTMFYILFLVFLKRKKIIIVIGLFYKLNSFSIYVKGADENHGV